MPETVILPQGSTVRHRNELRDVPLQPGPNTMTIRVRANDGVDYKDYSPSSSSGTTMESPSFRSTPIALSSVSFPAASLR